MLPRIKNPFRLIILIIISFISEGKSQSAAVTALPFPWAGGLNSAQFCNMDMDLNGTTDLLVFDRHGNRILPFINVSPMPGELNYRFAPDYIPFFPDLHDWVKTIDYDHDGKQDIFTYGHGGARVFRNISDTILRFELITDLLKSFYYTGKVGILITDVDYPAIADIDNDGDEDLLTFFGLGSYVEYHRNFSMEEYGIPDSLEFRLTDKCWGNFREGLESNLVTLNTTCPFKLSASPSGCAEAAEERHTGSTLQATDLNNDQVTDLILGDIDYPQLITLLNGGTSDSAHMISQDTVFPFASAPVHLWSFPACSHTDIDNDGKKDMIISPFDPSLNKSENFRSCLYYRNTGTMENPVFTFMKNRLFQDEMIDLGSGAYPVLADMDNDGLTDMIAGNYGYRDSTWYANGLLHSSFVSRISWYKNTGSALSPAFTLITDDLASLSQLNAVGLSPACADIDGDGDADLIAGREDGSLIFLENKGIQGSIPAFERAVFHYQNIDAGEFNTPQLFDLDNDGLTDLISGEKGGNLNWYRNTGTQTNPVFSLVTDSLGKVSVINYQLSYDGYSVPCFFRINGVTHLLVGSEDGRLHYFTNIDGNLTGAFTETPLPAELFGIGTLPVSQGIRTAPATGFLTSTSWPDLICGNFSGGFRYISREPAPGVINAIGDLPDSGIPAFGVFPNPADQSVKIDVHTSGMNKTELIDLRGRIVRTFETKGDFQFDVSRLPAGLYVLKISPLSSDEKHNHFIYKLLIQH